MINYSYYHVDRVIFICTCALWILIISYQVHSSVLCTPLIWKCLTWRNFIYLNGERRGKKWKDCAHGNQFTQKLYTGHIEECWRIWNRNEIYVETGPEISLRPLFILNHWRQYVQGGNMTASVIFKLPRIPFSIAIIRQVHSEQSLLVNQEQTYASTYIHTYIDTL